MFFPETVWWQFHIGLTEWWWEMAGKAWERQPTVICTLTGCYHSYLSCRCLWRTERCRGCSLQTSLLHKSCPGIWLQLIIDGVLTQDHVDHTCFICVTHLTRGCGCGFFSLLPPRVLCGYILTPELFAWIPVPRLDNKLCVSDGNFWVFSVWNSWVKKFISE